MTAPKSALPTENRTNFDVSGMDSSLDYNFTLYFRQLGLWRVAAKQTGATFSVMRTAHALQLEQARVWRKRRCRRRERGQGVGRV